MAKRSTREILLDTAEELFSERGVEAVSLRNINAAAGVSPGVLHYHFGSREALVEALLLRHMDQLMKERRERVAELTARVETPAIREIAEALVMPLAEMVLEEGAAGQRYVRFLARLYADRSELLWKVTSGYFMEALAPFANLIARVRPELPSEVINLRLTAAVHTMVQTLADIGSAPRPWQQELPEEARDPQLLIESLLDFIAGGLAAPMIPPSHS